MGAPPFTLLTPEVGAGKTPPLGWKPFPVMPSLILFGLTGAGKSTILARLMDEAGAVTLLPDRRALTDLLLIPAVQQADGLPQVRISDRVARFQLTRRYRELFPGGMAHALSKLYASPAAALPLLFDGLRGADEAAAACDLLPGAHFALLEAPDFTRLLRLLGRADAFDQVTVTAAGPDLPPEAEALFSRAECDHLRGLIAAGQVSSADVAAKLAIVAEEARSYSTQAALQALEQGAGGRFTRIDTTALSPEQAAHKLSEALSGLRSV